jgi:cytidylate kinase
MDKQPPPLPFDGHSPEPEPPRHGFQGDRGNATVPAGAVPLGLTIAVSREAGARGGSIGRRVGRKLGWQVYDQELLEYMAQDGPTRQTLAEALSPAGATWVEQQLERLQREENLSQHPSAVNLARVVLALGVQGRIVLIGRGAGFILPPESTLHIRLVAPLQDRIAYMSQWLRLTVEEAAERVRLRDTRRNEFVRTHFHREPDDVYQYDLVINSCRLGEEACAELIAQAARARSAARFGEDVEVGS